jgi:hypothetical protein
MLVKLTPLVNFINIFGAAFVPIFLRQSLIREKLHKTLPYKKVPSKMLVKLTPSLRSTTQFRPIGLMKGQTRR